MATETMIAELPAQALMGSLPTLLGRYQLTKGEAYAAAREARKVPLLTKERGVALQLELMATYSSPAFQKQLHELGRTLGPASSKFRAALCRMVRHAQMEVIPTYGFEPSEEGVETMLRAFKSLEKDPDIEVNSVAIRDLLSLEAPPMEMNEKNKVIERPVTKHRILDMLRVQLIEFSKATFQADVDELKKCADYNSGR
ncbi:unnamed protein product, partial [Symbiodinium pilosum]